jgi:hypothetical protein
MRNRENPIPIEEIEVKRVSALEESKKDPRELEKEATHLLKRHGYRSDGRPLGSVDFAQERFERKANPTPMGGKNEWKRKRKRR